MEKGPDVLVLSSKCNNSLNEKIAHFALAPSYMCSPSGLCATLAAMANARDVISIYLLHTLALVRDFWWGTFLEQRGRFLVLATRTCRGGCTPRSPEGSRAVLRVLRVLRALRPERAGGKGPGADLVPGPAPAWAPGPAAGRPNLGPARQAARAHRRPRRVQGRGPRPRAARPRSLCAAACCRSDIVGAERRVR